MKDGSIGLSDNLDVKAGRPKKYVNQFYLNDTILLIKTICNNVIESKYAIQNVLTDARSEMPETQVHVVFTNHHMKFVDSIPASTSSQSTSVLGLGSGTRIPTTRGEVTVEDLRNGDTAITVSGQSHTITWTSHRVLTADMALPIDKTPVRVRAGAFGQELPTRDLLLSAGHPILVGADARGEGSVLVPFMNLVNGTTIARTHVPSATYWHVELDSHDILLAEGLAAESLFDFGCRPFFEEVLKHALHNPDFVPSGLSTRCRRVILEGSLVEAERSRLAVVFSQNLINDCAWDVMVDPIALAAA